jgi:hypothetical protein
MSEDEPHTKSWIKWLAALSPLASGLLAVWTVAINQRLTVTENTLKERTVQLEAQRDRVARLTFVHEHLFPDLLGADARRRNMTIQLVRLTIPEDADSLFAGFRASADSGLRAVGTSGVSAAADERVALLVSQLVVPKEETRKAAFNELQTRFTGSTVAITYTLDALSPPNLSRLSADGRVNELLFLSQTSEKAWSIEQLTRGASIMTQVEATVTSETGKKTLDLVQQVRSIIRRAQERG